MPWHDDLVLRNQKKIIKKGQLLGKLFQNFKSKTKTRITQQELAEKIDLTPNRVSSLFAGTFEQVPQTTIEKFLRVINMPADVFRQLSKKTAIPGIGIFAQPVLGFNKPIEPIPTPTPTPTPTSETKQSPKQKTTKSAPGIKQPPKQKTTKPGKILNHTYDPLAVLIRANGDIEIYPSHRIPKTKSNETLIMVLGAAEFGNKLVPGVEG